VSTTDWGAGLAAPDPVLEAGLAELFAVDMPDAVGVTIDRRIREGLRTWSPARSRVARFRPGRRAGVVALLAAALAIGGANGSLRALYMFIAGPFDLPWHRGVELNLSQTVDGYRVTLDRAYADATRLALAISVVDERQRPGTTQLEAFSAAVTDESGAYGGLGAVSTPDGPYAAVNVAWKTPALLPLPSGPRKFHVVLPFIRVRDDSVPPPNADVVGWDPWHRVPGPWTFDFEMNVDGGTTVTPDVVADTGGIRAIVTRLIAAPSIVRVDLRIEGTPGPGGWNPIGEVRHDGRVARFVVVSLDGDGTFALMTDGGVGEASGHWTVTFSSLDSDGQPNVGPWVMEFDVP
jgi:hypothetical protein